MRMIDVVQIHLPALPGWFALASSAIKQGKSPSHFLNALWGMSLSMLFDGTFDCFVSVWNDCWTIPMLEYWAPSTKITSTIIKLRFSLMMDRKVMLVLYLSTIDLVIVIIVMMEVCFLCRKDCWIILNLLNGFDYLVKKNT